MGSAVIVTAAGRAADTASRLPGGAPLNIAAGTVVFGDGGGSLVTPADTQTTLINEIAHMPVSSVTLDSSDPTKYWVACVYGDQPGYTAPRNFTIREIGIKLPDGTLFLVGSYPETFVPPASSGIALSLGIRIPIMEVLAGANITLDENTSLYATEEWVLDNADHANLYTMVATLCAQLSIERAARDQLQKCADRTARDLAYLRSRLGI